MEVQSMDGERRIDVLKAEAQRLRDELQRIDQEVLDLYGKNGHGHDQEKGRRKEPSKRKRV
jgi:hypothetical protein